MAEVTINDIARRAGVSKPTVSYALNGRSGVSEQTRAHILHIADQLGWAPNHTARLLSGSHAGAYGLVMARSPAVLGTEEYFMQLIAGIQQVLSMQEIPLLFQLTPDLDTEIATHRQWWSQRRVDGVVVIDLRLDDPRVPALRDLGMPALFLTGAPVDGMRTVLAEDQHATLSAVEHLIGLGHHRIARAAGNADMVHVRARDDAFADVLARYGLHPQLRHADFTAEAGRTLTRQLMNLKNPPTAIIYDNDLMAVAGLNLLTERGIRVPADISILTWEDSALCGLTHPPLTALHRDVFALGRLVAHRLLETSDADTTTNDQIPDACHIAPELTIRSSTGQPNVP